MSTEPHIFADAAPALRRAGFAVLPAHGKEPTRKGFSKWKHAPGQRAVEEWAVKDPTANIVYVPGLCRTERGGDPIIVIATCSLGTHVIDRGLVEVSLGSGVAYRIPWPCRVHGDYMG